MLGGGRDVEPPVNIDAEPIAATRPELLDDPFAGAVGQQAHQAASFDDDQRAGRFARDAVAVHESVGDELQRAVGVQRPHPAGLPLGEEVVRIREEDGAGLVAHEIVRCLKAVGHEVVHVARG